jgi:hypothetical protein
MNRRTTFITAAAVAGVVLAGTTAVAANIGILTAADNNNLGELNASAVVTTVPAPDPQIIDVYLEDPALSPTLTTTLNTVSETSLPGTTVAQPFTQQFNVEDAGTVTIRQADTGILLDGVVANGSWSWTSSQTSPTEVTVSFTAPGGGSAGAEYVFYASLDADGTIVARVDQPIVNIVQAPSRPAPASNASSAPTAPAGGYVDDDHDESDHGAEHVEYEGGEDDD